MTDADVEQLLQEVQREVREIARRHLSDAVFVEEAMQEHALAVWGLRKDLDETRNARSYVVDRMHYVCLRIKQAQFTRQAPTEPLDAILEPPAGDEASHLRDLDVRRAFDKLPSHLWVVAWLVHGEGFLVSETARRLGLPKLLTEQRLAEATRLLQGMLKGWR